MDHSKRNLWIQCLPNWDGYFVQDLQPRGERVKIPPFIVDSFLHMDIGKREFIDILSRYFSYPLFPVWEDPTDFVRLEFRLLPCDLDFYLDVESGFDIDVPVNII